MLLQCIMGLSSAFSCNLLLSLASLKLGLRRAASVFPLTHFPGLRKQVNVGWGLKELEVKRPTRIGQVGLRKSKLATVSINITQAKTDVLAKIRTG